MSIGLRIILGCTLPVLLLVSLYACFTVYNVSNVVDRDIDNWGKIISSSLMESSAQAIIAGQAEFLDKNALHTLTLQKEIAFIEWRKSDGTSIYRTTAHASANHLHSSHVSEFPVYFRQRINMDAFDADLQLDQTGGEHYESRQVGWLLIGFNDDEMTREAYRKIYRTLGLLLLLLVVVVVAASANAFRLSRAIRQFFEFIGQLDRGEYHKRIKPGKHHDMQTLGQQLNKLAETLERNQQQIKAEKEALNLAISNLTDARNEADKANNWLKKMLSILSHEMRTPLNAIVGSIDMAISQSKAPFVIKRLENAISHANHMVSELENLLDYIQIDENHAISNTVPTNIYTLLEIITTNYRNLAEEKNLTLQMYHIGDDNHENLHLAIDQQRFSQVLINLVSNAIKFSVKGSVSITSRIEKNEDHSYQITIEVADQGIGIPQDRLQDIFTIFQQVDFDIARHYDGLGIGLALSKKYVDMLGGKLSVSSQLSYGSIFHFSFTAAAVPVSQSHTGITTTRPAPERIQTIFIVEDNIVNCNVLCELLRRALPNVNLITESDGRKALDALLSGCDTFDLALIDIHLPGISGIDIIRQIRSRHPGRKIVAVTADSTFHTQDACFLAGADLFIKKPIRLQDIYRILNG